MDSAFGIDHGEVSKGLPSAVRAGGGGSVGRIMRAKNASGREMPFYPKHMKSIFTDEGKRLKGQLKQVRSK